MKVENLFAIIGIAFWILSWLSINIVTCATHLNELGELLSNFCCKLSNSCDIEGDIKRTSKPNKPILLNETGIMDVFLHIFFSLSINSILMSYLKFLKVIWLGKLGLCSPIKPSSLNKFWISFNLFSVSISN